MESTSNNLSHPRKKPVIISYLLCALIMILSTTGFYHLSLDLLSQIRRHQAEGCFRKGDYERAGDYLEKAAAHSSDDYKIQKLLGEVWFRLGEGEADIRDRFLRIEKSKDFFLRAYQLNPLDAEIAYRLGRGEARLEKLYHKLYPKRKNNPYHPLPYFEDAVRLRPNGIQYNYALARYLHKKGKEAELFRLVRRIAGAYPQVYGYLKKEKFWSPRVKEAYKAGLKDAIRNDVSPKIAYHLLSSISAQEENWPGAISYYKKSMEYRAFENNSGNYIHLGNLYLRNREFAKAEKCFLHALSITRTLEKDIERIYHLFKREKNLRRFQVFYTQIKRHFTLSFRMDILMARSWIELKEYEAARKLLREVNERNPSAEVYYWLYHIANQEKDWDAMELTIQKATVLDPENSRYHLIFSNVLNRLKKLERAEKEAELAITYQSKPSPWLFNRRAQIRWRKGDYAGAIEDWKSAADLKPDRPNFYASMAEAYIKLDQPSLSKKYYQRAIRLAPDNQQYKKRYLAIKTGN